MPRRGGSDMRVSIRGLRDFERELAGVDSPRELEQDLRAEADRKVAKLVIGRAKRRARSRLEKKAARTLTTDRVLGREAVSGGGTDSPWFGGAEFGAAQNKPRVRSTGVYLGYRQFDEYGPDGVFLYPAIADSNDEIREIYGDAMERILAGAFPD